MWWKLVKKMAGKSEKKSNFSFDRDGKTLEQPELVNVLNECYASVNSDIPPINVTTLPTFLPAPSRQDCDPKQFGCLKGTSTAYCLLVFHG